MYYALEVIKQEYADERTAKELLEKRQLHTLSMEYLRDKEERLPTNIWVDVLFYYLLFFFNQA